jgi:hypothetical protein
LDGYQVGRDIIGSQPEFGIDEDNSIHRDGRVYFVFHIQKAGMIDEIQGLND